MEQIPLGEERGEEALLAPPGVYGAVLNEQYPQRSTQNGRCT